ncbi:hypothetical protein ES703_118724 [subsurface metagenome]
MAGGGTAGGAGWGGDGTQAQRKPVGGRSVLGLYRTPAGAHGHNAHGRAYME